jgi:hypothetical protein
MTTKAAKPIQKNTIINFFRGETIRYEKTKLENKILIKIQGKGL